AEVKGLTKAQRDWQAKLDRDYVWAYYREHQKEAAVSPRPALEAEDVLPLFPVEQAGKTSPGPVRFVNEAGHYEPGRLAAAEKGKLPPDAVAVVQQLLLWFPTDTRLFWLLGELYAADGDVSSARTIFDKCVNARQYGNRKLLMDHRAAVLAALETRKPPAEPPPPAEDAQPPTEPTAQPVPIGLGAVWIYFGVVAAIVVLAAVRVLVRRGKGNCGPIG
ncbi:MAG TPA: hypothetical protein VKE74_19805, partial [Gemmataceae bacterium]|nr:hypothetical protein [Gemmataceae bacterium]